MSSRHPFDARRSGMTLVELMIVLVILAGITALAWPTFQQAVQRSRRADGIAALSEILQAQERWRANNPSYQATLASLPGARTVSHDGHYDLSLVDGSVNGTRYTARATVRSTSPQSGDSRCQVLQVAVAGGNITYSSLASGNTANAAPDPCWPR